MNMEMALKFRGKTPVSRVSGPEFTQTHVHRVSDAPSVHGASPGKNTGVGCHALLLGMRMP